MLTAAEIYRTASLMIDQYGEMAPAGAFIRADQLKENGDLTGRALWLKVAQTAEALLSERVPLGTRVH
jgi:hypothetical protein